jgi:hypothetical protein
VTGYSGKERYGRPDRPGHKPRRVKMADVPDIKGMLIRGDPQSDIAAYFGTNGGRIAEINTDQRWAWIEPAPPDKLPPPGPYPVARAAVLHRKTLLEVRETLATSLARVDAALRQADLWDLPGDDDGEGGG